jgi:hypothetical protein
MIKLSDILNEMYPPYKANMVGKVKYRASDIFTNDPKIAVKKGYTEKLSKNTEYRLVSELITDTDVICECGWTWKIKDGGDEPYLCHKCGHDNSI